MRRLLLAVAVGLVSAGPAPAFGGPVLWHFHHKHPPAVVVPVAPAVVVPHLVAPVVPQAAAPAAPEVGATLDRNHARLNDVVYSANALMDLVGRGDPRLRGRMKAIDPVAAPPR